MNEREKLIQRNLDKMATKEAIQEWLDAKWDETQLSIGKWFLRAVGLLLFTGLVYFILWANGWHKP